MYPDPFAFQCFDIIYYYLLWYIIYIYINLMKRWSVFLLGGFDGNTPRKRRENFPPKCGFTPYLTNKTANQWIKSFSSTFTVTLTTSLLPFKHQGEGQTWIKSQQFDFSLLMNVSTERNDQILHVCLSVAGCFYFVVYFVPVAVWM